MNARPKPVVLATGGSGGHVFPAQALAAELRRKNRPLAIITDRRGNAFNGLLGQTETFCVHASGVSGRSVAGSAAAMVQIGFGLLEALIILRRLKPAAVVGFGSYASVPSVFAASLLSIPTVIHEQNAVLGRATRAGRRDGRYREARRSPLEFPGCSKRSR